MGQNISNEDLLSQIARLEARTRALETALKMGDTTQHGGTYAITDAAGTLTYFKFGFFPDRNGNTVFGMYATGDGTSASRVLEVGPKGLQLPGIPIPMQDSTRFVQASAAGFNAYFTGQISSAWTDAVQAEFFVRAHDGSSGGQVRLNLNAGAAVTSAVTVPVGSAGFFVTFNWLHTQPIGTGPFLIYIEGNNTAGNGIDIRTPDQFEMVASIYCNATATGL